MKLETFFQKFELLADAPDAVAKVRALILRSAMLGKLSEPNSNDGLVDQLLQKVERDKARIGLERSGKSATTHSEFLDEEIADEIPARWTWVRFGSIARHNAGKTLDMGRNRGQLRDYITTSNLYWGFFQIDAVRQMPIADEELERCTALKGDLLICEGGEAGRAAVWPHHREIAFQNHIHRARLFAGINPFFIQRYFEKLNATGEIEKYRKGVGISNMSGKALASIPIPLPTVAEQSRIVAKVDALMALCDHLEAQQQERETRHTALARATLAQFADAPTPANLNYIFHPSYNIPPAELRKTIIDLASQGKIAPFAFQEPPVRSVLQDRRGMRQQIWEQVNGKKKPYEPPIGINLEDFPSIPQHWGLEALGLLGIDRFDTVQTGPFGAQLYSSEFVKSGVPVVAVGNLTELGLSSKGLYYITEEKAQQLSRYDVQAGDLLFARTGATLGKVCIAPAHVKDWRMTGHILRVRLDPEVIDPTLVMFFLTASGFVKGQVTDGIRGLTRPGFNTSLLERILIPVPPLVEQRQIIARVMQLSGVADSLEAQLVSSRIAATRVLEAVSI